MGTCLPLITKARLFVDPGEEDAAEQKHDDAAEIEGRVAVAEQGLAAEVDPDLPGGSITLPFTIDRRKHLVTHLDRLAELVLRKRSKIKCTMDQRNYKPCNSGGA